ncbi:hypothetical protein [Granulosicoccus antarcticus]|uniref:Flagellar FliJ protein n=1 Tax=Granulosicoccus antarcticus IMCC3135 TaxID=1192854 RepID=A0A2Z2NVS8_9GAMM|nr:hypothetical protein [Granulosicoccus antarcticus]ASJ71777.1 hypothetical protein IMCC3135_08390 [Granulosicoccus antarcticus IMCC3135]
MSSQQLSKLEALSQTRADQSSAAVAKKQAELKVIDRQHLELKAINREYQEGVIGQESISPQLLAHRRAFVASLTVKLDELKQKRQQQDHQLKATIVEQQQRTAQTAAIATIVERNELNEADVAARREQVQLEESAQSMKYLRQQDSENKHA